MQPPDAVMSGPLAGTKVVEVGMWAFIPSAGAMLSDMGADVVKIEPPQGDPIRWLTTSGIKPGAYGFTFLWEIFNRGKRSIALDLNAEGALEVLHRMLEKADVFLTSLLPATRRRLKIDIPEITTRHPNLIYGVGSALGAHGPEAEKGGFDTLSYWARSGMASAATPDDSAFPPPPPGGAFGDCASGVVLAGGIAAALVQRMRSGKASVVDASLLATGMWMMQPGITATALTGTEELPKPSRNAVPNPLLNHYRTRDGRFISLSMLQGQRYWPEFCKVIGRQDLADDARFSTDASRAANIGACVALLDEIFAAKDLAEWRAILARQDGQWEVIQKVGELSRDRAAVANGLVQDVNYGNGRAVKMVSTPVQFDRQALTARPAPELGADSDEILAELGFSEDQIIGLRVAGIVH